MTIFLMLAALGLATTAPASKPHPSSEPKTATAVLAADDAWGAAEASGDAAFVDWLLVPEYKSVGPDGKSTPKSAIVAGARLRAGRPVGEAAASVSAWKAAHPLRGDVALIGDTAILTWISVKPGSSEPVSSCDVFIYRDGHWHGVYSQHSSAAV